MVVLHTEQMELLLLIKVHFQVGLLKEMQVEMVTVKTMNLPAVAEVQAQLDKLVTQLETVVMVV